ncbi:hypothetical protein [Macrococcus bovicus]|uniref:Cthe-2314-like HEPN domain-containing protein n=1 Tax=Macrococcus bovicus TaxID=69968 RepID=A0A4R6C370_9STAP|nr:hypothetical protein [Macrococcus bovicus]TDM15603.1 hypothetical protein ERX55_01475 [Macrococcus bovicus]
MAKNQFLIKYDDPNSLISAFGLGPIGGRIEEKLFDLLNIYDNNVFLYSFAEEKFQEIYDKVIESDFDLSLLIKASFYLNVCLRMINTLDDILLKIIVYTHLHFNGKSESELDDESNDYRYRNYYDKFIAKSNTGYPQRATRSNRKTRKIRNDITHSGDTLLISNPIKEDDSYTVVSDKGLMDRNVELYTSIIFDMQDDIDEINKVRQQIETIILNDPRFIKK